MEMNYCRRCGKPLTHLENNVYKCAGGHTLFANASPTVGILFVNDQHEVLLAIRKYDPGKGNLDMPGGFCDGAETIEDGLVRELHEELGLRQNDFENLELLLTHIDPYDYQGETIQCLCSVYTGRLKPGANPQPADDVAEVAFMTYDSIDHSKVQFPSIIAGLEVLRQRGVL